MQSTPPIDAVLSSIARAEHLLVTAHARPDGDAIGGLLACWMMLQRMGKRADMALSDRVPCIYRSLPCAAQIRHWSRVEGDYDTVILLECDGIERTRLDGLENRILINIDHHTSGRAFADVNWIDSSACAVAELVSQLAGALRGPVPDPDLAGAGTGVVEGDAVLGAHLVRDDDVAIAMASSGLHSNGYSLVRHVLLTHGALRLHDHIDELGRTLGEELLVPTRIYSLDCLALIKAIGVDVHAFSHVTGGGLAANLDRVLPEGIDIEIDRTTWAPAPIFELVRRVGNVATPELERTLNMGVGMVAVIAADAADRSLHVLADRGVPAWVAGQARTGTERAPGTTTLVGAHAH